MVRRDMSGGPRRPAGFFTWTLFGIADFIAAVPLGVVYDIGASVPIPMAADFRAISNN